MEIWKTIENFPEYQVSNQGRVLNLKNGKFIGSKTAQVYLTNSGGSAMIYIRQLVAEAFLSKPPSENYKLRHINGDRMDSTVGNLIYRLNKTAKKDHKDHKVEKKSGRYWDETDEELVRQWKTADRRLQTRIYSRLEPKILHMIRTFMYKYKGRIDEELAHEWLTHVFMNLHKFNPETGRAFTFVSVVVRNHIIDELKKKNQMNYDDNVQPDEIADPCVCYDTLPVSERLEALACVASTKHKNMLMNAKDFYDRFQCLETSGLKEWLCDRSGAKMDWIGMSKTWCEFNNVIDKTVKTWEIMKSTRSTI